MQIGLSRISLGVESQQRGNVAHSLHQKGLTLRAELSDHGLTLFPITDRNLDLDQLMITERAIELFQNGWRQSFPSHGYDRFQRMGLCAELA